ncbi:hypothetical protein E2C01_102177 [Portunus trituberculatus]|uniref:Uncharacterized protein n=1 Tax=Portunus trituberculatus TaxID=210409 RepID=A0A5B7KM61_PORTR|nr:hypothetical protein [Portunus trituberculatus]
MLVCPQIAFLIGRLGGGRRERSNISSSEWRLDQYYSRHHARYISPVTTLPAAPPVNAAQCSSFVVGLTFSSGRNSNGKLDLRDGGFSCGGVTCC